MGQCCVCVKQDEYVAVEQLGAFKKMLPPGFHCLGIDVFNVCMQVRRISSRVVEYKLITETKTEDNVFVKLRVAVQVEVVQDKAYESIYKLSNVEQQIQSFVSDVVRGQVPKMKLDDLFESRDKIVDTVKERLVKQMAEYGYIIHQVLIVGVYPDGKVKQAMNDINASQRMRMAAQDQAEAAKILQVKAAEADAESKLLIGQGIALQRNAISNGMRDSLGGEAGLSSDRVQELLLMTQYFDCLEKLSAGGARTVFMPGGAPPGFEGQMGEGARVFSPLSPMGRVAV